jgi:hypothetical protein
MEPGEHEKAVIEAYFDVLRDGGVDRLAGLVTYDCDDRNPVRGQLQGRFGVMQKVLLFRADHPGARIVIESIEAVPEGARATWRTTAPGLSGTPAESTWRYTAVFGFEGGKLKSSVVERSERVD